MSSAGDELGRRLLASVRRERPSQALRERVLSLANTESTSTEIGNGEGVRLEAVPQTRTRRARVWAGLLACAAGVCAVVWGLREHSAPIAISAERARQAAPQPEAASPPAPPSEDEAAAKALEPVPPTLVPAVREPPARSTRKAPVVEEQGVVVAPPASLGEQLAQLKSARALLRAGDPGGALRVLDAYRSGTRGSELGAEAAMLRIEALAASGKAEEASNAARRFASEYPTSPLIDRARGFAEVGVVQPVAP